MNKPLELNDLNDLKMELQNAIEKDKKYWRINEVKCDAILTARTYEEFRYTLNKIIVYYFKTLICNPYLQ